MSIERDTNRAANALEAAYAEGGISEASKDALLAVPDIGREIGASLGISGQAGELLLVTILADDSESIGYQASEVRQGHTLMLEALGGGFATEVLVHTRLLSGGVLSPYKQLSEAARLTGANYSASAGSTPLYAQSVITLGSVMAKAREEEAAGRRVRTFTLIITDGEDNASLATTATAVRHLVTDMLEFATNHIVAGMGIGDPDVFRRILRGMGIPAAWIFTPSSSVDELRAVFKTVADSLELAATSESGFLQLTSGPVSGSA